MRSPEKIRECFAAACRLRALRHLATGLGIAGSRIRIKQWTPRIRFTIASKTNDSTSVDNHPYEEFVKDLRVAVDVDDMPSTPTPWARNIGRLGVGFDQEELIVHNAMVADHKRRHFGKANQEKSLHRKLCQGQAQIHKGRLNADEVSNTATNLWSSIGRAVDSVLGRSIFPSPPLETFASAVFESCLDQLDNLIFILTSYDDRRSKSLAVLNGGCLKITRSVASVLDLFAAGPCRQADELRKRLASLSDVVRMMEATIELFNDNYRRNTTREHVP